MWPRILRREQLDTRSFSMFSRYGFTCLFVRRSPVWAAFTVSRLFPLIASFKLGTGGSCWFMVDVRAHRGWSAALFLRTVSYRVTGYYNHCRSAERESEEGAWPRSSAGVIHVNKREARLTLLRKKAIKEMCCSVSLLINCVEKEFYDSGFCSEVLTARHAVFHSQHLQGRALCFRSRRLSSEIDAMIVTVLRSGDHKIIKKTAITEDRAHRIYQVYWSVSIF